MKFSPDNRHPSPAMIREAMTNPDAPSPAHEARTLGRVADDADALDVHRHLSSRTDAPGGTDAPSSPLCQCLDCQSRRAAPNRAAVRVLDVEHAMVQEGRERLIASNGGPTVYVGNERHNDLSPTLTAVERARANLTKIRDQLVAGTVRADGTVARVHVPNAGRPVWETTAAGLARQAHAQMDLEIEVGVVFEHDRGERRDHDYPGTPEHVRPVAAYPPEQMARAILRNLAYELGSSSFKAIGHGMLSEESIHDFIRNAGDKILNILAACGEEAADLAEDQDPIPYRK